MSVFNNCFGDSLVQLGTNLNPPFGFELLTDSNGSIMRDSFGSVIYVLKS